MDLVTEEYLWMGMRINDHIGACYQDYYSLSRGRVRPGENGRAALAHRDMWYRVRGDDRNMAFWNIDVVPENQTLAGGASGTIIDSSSGTGVSRGDDLGDKPKGESGAGVEYMADSGLRHKVRVPDPSTSNIWSLLVTLVIFLRVGKVGIGLLRRIGYRHKVGEL